LQIFIEAKNRKRNLKVAFKSNSFSAQILGMNEATGAKI
jgi:hypothetical protein